MAEPVDVAQLPLAGAAQQALSELQNLTDAPALKALSANQLMGERALLGTLTYADGCSAGGSCLLLSTADTTIALSLPRPTDWQLLPAWLEIDQCPEGRWHQVAQAVAERAAQPLIDRAHLLGLAAATMGQDCFGSMGGRESKGLCTRPMRSVRTCV